MFHPSFKDNNIMINIVVFIESAHKKAASFDLLCPCVWCNHNQANRVEQCNFQKCFCFESVLKLVQFNVIANIN